MRARVVAVTVVVVGLGSWAFVAWLDQRADLPQPAAESPPLPSLPAASVSDGPREVQFRVSLTINGERARGDRLVLYALQPDGGFGTQQVDGPLSATGQATLRVPEGPWLVARPGGPHPRVVNVTRDTRSVDIVCDEFVLRGRVLDARGAAVVGAVVDCGGALVGTDRSGVFAASFDTDDEVSVSLHDSPGAPKLRVRPSAGEVTLAQP